MSLRNLRATGLRRIARGRSGFVALAVILYIAAGVSALPSRAERRPSPRPDLELAAALALGNRAGSPRERLVAGPRWGGGHVDSALGQGPPRARRNSVLHLLRPRSFSPAWCMQPP